MTDIQKIAEKFIELWGLDGNTKDFSRKVGVFISQLNGNQELGAIFLELIKRYEYYSRLKINEILSENYNYIETKLHLRKATTVYSRIEDDSKIDSSNTLLEEFKIHNSIPNSYSHDISKISIENFDYIDNVVFIDDIIGSGCTVKKFFESHIEKLKKVKTYIFCIIILEEAKDFLNKYFSEMNIQCEIIFYSMHNKAFFKDYIFCEDCFENEEKFKTFESSLHRKNSKMIMGYNNSQALVTFFRNTPNNTLSSFWLENNQWKGLFPRVKERPIFLENSNSRKNVLYQMKRMGNLDNGKN